MVARDTANGRLKAAPSPAPVAGSPHRTWVDYAAGGSATMQTRGGQAGITSGTQLPTRSPAAAAYCKPSVRFARPRHNAGQTPLHCPARTSHTKGFPRTRGDRPSR